MVAQVSADGNGRHAVPEWIRSHLSTIIVVSCGVVANWALLNDRTDRNAKDIAANRAELALQLGAAEQRLNERFTALSVRLTGAEGEWREEHDLNVNQTNNLLAFQARLQADQETRDVRSKARDDQIDAVVSRVQKLEDSDRLNGQWQATITERLTNMSGQLAQLVRLLDQRLPDAPPDKAGRQR